MWPTYYLGLGAGGEDVYLVAQSLYEGSNLDASPGTLTIPAGAAVGDFAILTWRSSSVGAMSATTQSNILAAGWVPWSSRPQLNRSTGSTSWQLVGSGPFNKVEAWYKFLGAGDLAGVSLALSSGSYTFSAMMLAFRNVHPTCPMFNRRDFGNSVNNTLGKTLGTALRFHDERNRQLVIFSTPWDSVISDMYSEISPAPVASGGDYDSSVGGNGIYYGVYAPDLTRASYNLISDDVFGFPVEASWGLFGVSSIQNFTESNNSTYGNWRGLETNATSLHYVYREVSLVAGQKYTLVLRSNSGSNARYLWASVDDGSTEKCAWMSQWGADPITNGEGTLQPFDHVLTIPGTQDYISTALPFSNTSLFLFTAEVTGTHQIRIGRSTSNTEASRSYAGTITQGAYIVNLALVPGWGIPEIYDWAQNTAPTDYPFSMNGPVISMQNSITESSVGFAIELLHKNAQVPAQRINFYSINSLADHWPHLNEAETVEGLTMNIDSVYYAGGNAGGLKGDGSQHVSYRGLVPLYTNAIDPNVPTKVYFEYTYVAANPVALDAANVGVAVSEMGKFVRHSVALYSGSSGSDFVFFDTARYAETYGMLHNGFLTLNYDRADVRGNLAVGEVIGIAIDRDSLEVKVYVNGTLQGTGTMEWSPPFEVFFANDHSGPNGEVAFNFTGPFSYLPVGYSAWDYRNAA